VNINNQFIKNNEMNFPKSHLFGYYIGFEYKFQEKNKTIFDSKKLDSNTIKTSSSSNKKYQSSKLFSQTSDHQNEINHLNGSIGTILMFDEVFPEEIQKKIIELEEEYELVLYRNYDYKHINLISKQYNIIHGLSKLDNLKIEQNLLLYISANVKF